MKKIMLLGSFLISITTLAARLTDGKIKAEVTKNNKEINMTVAPGFHFNAQAPASMTTDSGTLSQKPTLKTEKQFTFKIPDGAKEANISLYVCDNKKTVCEQQKIKIEVATAKTSQREQKTSSNEAPALIVSPDEKPTLLVFSAPWCPACIRMQTETYPIPAVAEQLKKIHFKKLNSDLVENFELSEKFHIKAIPTLILLNAQGEEVYRWLDFQPAQSFAKSLASESRKIEGSGPTLQAQATQGDWQAAAKLGMREYNSMNCAEAVKWLSLSKNEKDQNYKLAAEVSCAQEKSDQDEKSKIAYIQTLEKAIVLSSSEWDQTRWLINWIEKKKEGGALSEDIKAKALAINKKIEAYLSQSAQAKKLFAESTFGESGGFEKEEMLNAMSIVFGLLELPEEKLKIDARSIQLIGPRKLSTSRPGEMLMAIAYLREAGETKKVESMYEALIKKYPNTYVYFEKYARYQLKNKNLEPALALSEKALQHNEGNAPQMYLLKTRILKEMKNKKLALETIEEALRTKDISHARFKKTQAQLKTIQEEIKKE